MHGLPELVGPEIIMEWVGASGDRSIIAAELSTAHTAPLSELPRRLLTAFGAEGPVGRVLAARANSTDRVLVGGFSSFFEQQVQVARDWTQDTEPEVARWGTARLAELEARRDRELAREEFEDRYQGRIEDHP